MSFAPSIFQILIAFATALVISYLAWRMGSLSQSGALAALVLGTLTMGIGLRFGGPAVLLGFFISGSLLSKRTAKLRPESANIAAKSGPGMPGRCWPMGGCRPFLLVAGFHRRTNFRYCRGG